MNITISNIKYDNCIGWCYDITANKTIKINNKKIELKLQEHAVSKYICDYNVEFSKVKLTPAEFKKLKEEKNKFVVEIKQILNLK